MYGSLITLQNHPLNGKGQHWVLSEEDIEKFEDTIFSDERLGFRKVKFSIRVEQIAHFFRIAMIKHVEKSIN
jgi:hypothetical protein